MPIVYVLRSQIVSYNATHHTFLCKANWIIKVERVPKPSSIKHPIHFGVHPLDGLDGLDGPHKSALTI